MEDFSKGFTYIPNNIFNILPLTDLTERQWRVVCLIIRLTYGCHTRWVKLKLSDLKSVNIEPSNAHKIVDELLQKEIIVRNEKTKEYRINEEHIISTLTKEAYSNLVKLRKLVGQQIAVYYQKNNPEIIKNRTENLSIKEEYGYQSNNINQLSKREVPASNNGNFSSLKDIIKKEKYISDKYSVAGENIFYKTDSHKFDPNDPGETAAKDTWERLEPNNNASFYTTYLKAHREGLPSSLFYQFASEIEQDSSIENRGAVFNKKVQQYMERRNNEKE